MNDDPLIRPDLADADPLVIRKTETPSEGIHRLDETKVGRRIDEAHPLLASAESLTAEIVALRKSIVLLEEKKGSRLAVIGSYVLWLVDIALIVFVGVLLHNQTAQNARIEASIREQCSLYGLIIPSYRESARTASPLGPEGYDNAYRQIQISADRLTCNIPHKVPGT